MKIKYPNTAYMLSGYFHQDFDLDYSNPYEAADDIVYNNKDNPRLENLYEELKFIILNENTLSDEFFYSLGLDMAPFNDSYENLKFLKYIFHEIEKRRSQV